MTSLGEMINKLNDKNQNSLLRDDIDNVTEQISNKLTEAAKNTNGQRNITNTAYQNKEKLSRMNFSQNKWFDEKCKENRKKNHKYKKEYNRKKKQVRATEKCKTQAEIIKNQLIQLIKSINSKNRKKLKNFVKRIQNCSGKVLRKKRIN